MEIIPLTSRLEVLADFLEKGKLPATTGETREEGNLLARGCLLLVNMEQSMLPLETLHEQGMEYFLQPHLLLRAVELCRGQGIYSLPQICFSWMELEDLELKKD